MHPLSCLLLLIEVMNSNSENCTGQSQVGYIIGSS